MARDIISFSMKLAQKIGFENAGFIQDIAYWIDHNRSSNVNFFEGRYWSFSTQEELCNRHPYWTRRQIQRIVENCKNNGWLLVGNFNKNPYDRTNWYSISDEIMDLIFGEWKIQDGLIERTKPCEGANGTVRSSSKKNDNNKNDNKDHDALDENYPFPGIQTGEVVQVVNPTLDEVIEYAESRDRVDLAEKFFDYYDPANWYDRDGKRVRNWKQKFISWELNNPKPNRKQQEESEKRKYDYGDDKDGWGSWD